MRAALEQGRIDGVLHFSRRSVESYLDCGRDISGPALAPVHYCLSARAAEPLRLAGAARIQWLHSRTRRGCWLWSRPKALIESSRIAAWQTKRSPGFSKRAPATAADGDRPGGDRSSARDAGEEAAVEAAAAVASDPAATGDVFIPPEPPSRQPASGRPRRPAPVGAAAAAAAVRVPLLPEPLPWARPALASAAAGGLLGGPAAVAGRRVLGRARCPRPDLGPAARRDRKAVERSGGASRRRPSVDPKAIDDLAARLARLESAQAAPRAPVTDPVVLGRSNAAENATKSLADNAAAMSAAPTLSEAAVRDTNSRIDRLQRH